METDNLKSLWKSVQDKESKECLLQTFNIEEIIQREHCNVLVKMLHDALKGLLANTILLAIWIGLLFYAYIFLNLHFSFISNLMFGVISLYLLFSVLLGASKYYLIRKEDNTPTIKESFLSFREKLLRTNRLYLVVLTAYFYLLLGILVFALAKDLKGIYQSGMFFPILFVILMIMGIPWLIKIETKRRFRKLFRNLDESMHALENEVN